jgi:hypothetical protein
MARADIQHLNRRVRREGQQRGSPSEQGLTTAIESHPLLDVAM